MASEDLSSTWDKGNGYLLTIKSDHYAISGPHLKFSLVAARRIRVVIKVSALEAAWTGKS